MKLDLEEKLDFQDVLILPKMPCDDFDLNSRNQVNLLDNGCDDDFGKVIPIIASNMDSVGTFAMAKALFNIGLMTCLTKHYKISQYIEFFKSLNEEENKKVFYSIGANRHDLNKLKEVVKEVYISNICLDVANAYLPLVKEFLDEINEICPKSIKMVGNIATPDIISSFKKYNVKYLKCGIGSGSVCTTRIITGVGVPQFSCILECAKEANSNNIKICSDGGIKQIGDISKAFGAGASLVMVGSLFAGCDECEGEWTMEATTDTNQKLHYVKKKLKFYGMSSLEAMNKYYGGKENYKASEGKCIHVNYKGPVNNIVNEVLGGLRSSGTYVGAKTLKEFTDLCRFIKVRRTHNSIYD